MTSIVDCGLWGEAPPNRRSRRGAERCAGQTNDIKEIELVRSVAMVGFNELEKGSTSSKKLTVWKYNGVTSESKKEKRKPRKDWWHWLSQFCLRVLGVFFDCINAMWPIIPNQNWKPSIYLFERELSLVNDGILSNWHWTEFHPVPLKLTVKYMHWRHFNVVDVLEQVLFRVIASTW